MMRAAMASTSAAISGVKNSNLIGAAECAELCACCAAASAAGQCVATQLAETQLTLWKRNSRRERASCMPGAVELCKNCMIPIKMGQGKTELNETVSECPAPTLYRSESRETGR